MGVAVLTLVAGGAIVSGALYIVSGWILPTDTHAAIWRAFDRVMGLFFKLVFVALAAVIVWFALKG